MVGTVLARDLFAKRISPYEASLQHQAALMLYFDLHSCGSSSFVQA